METIKRSASLLLVLILLFSCFAPVLPVSAEELSDSEPPQASAAAPPGEKIPESTAETTSDPTVAQEETIAETEPTEPLIPETQPPTQETNPEEQTTSTLASFLESCNASISIDFLEGFAVREGTQLEVSETELDTKTLAACMEAAGMSSIVKSCGFTLGIPNTEFEEISFQTKIYFNQSSFPALNGKCVSVVQIYPDGRMKRLEASSFVEEKRLQELAFSVEKFTHGTQFVFLASDHPTVLVAHSIWGVYAVQGYQNISVGQASRLRDVTYHYVDDPSTPGYCLEPHKTFGYATGGGASSSTVGISNWGSQHGDTVWSGLNENQRKAIGLIAMLGLNQNTFDWGSHSSSGTSVLNPVNPNQCSFAAAQIMIWEVVGGWRSFPNPSVCYDSRVIDNFDRGNVRSAYDALNGKIRAWEQTTTGRRLSVENSRYRLSWVTSRDQVVLTVTQFAYETLVPPTGNISVSKNVRGSGSVQNWKFELYRSRANADSAAGPVMSAYTNSRGVATFYNVNNGTYYIREAPASRQDRVNAAGWGLSSSVLQGTVNGSNINVGTITNTAPAGAIRVKKSLDSSDMAGKLNGWIFQVSGSQNFSSITTTIATDASGEGVTEKVLSPGTYYVREAPKDELRAAMEAYNRRIFEEEQSGFCSAEAYETSSFLLTDYGREDEVFCVISIPRLQIEMPIYLGASKENLALGAAHLSQTSLPIGGANSNCVIAGHRGWRGGSYFRDLPKLKPGDQVVITNLWETLAYEVQQVQEVAAQKSKVLMIQPERDLLTLMTCAYGANGVKNRYLVICSRVEESSANTN